MLLSSSSMAPTRSTEVEPTATPVVTGRLPLLVSSDRPRICGLEKVSPLADLFSNSNRLCSKSGGFPSRLNPHCDVSMINCLFDKLRKMPLVFA
jgi:hypothetical protein